jgi:hypothetical protein
MIEAVLTWFFNLSSTEADPDDMADYWADLEMRRSTDFFLYEDHR